MEHFLSDNVRLAYLVEGVGDPIVLAHGFASTHGVNWVEPGWVDCLVKEGRQVIMFDLRGHGESEKLFEPSEYDRSAMAGDIANLLAHLGHEQADIMGYSLGGMLALRLACEGPSVCRRVIVAGVGEVMFAPAHTAEPVVQSLLADSLHEATSAVGRAFRVFADRNGQNREALAACYSTAHRPLMSEDLKSVSMPVLVVTGEKDVIAGAPGPLAAALGNGEAFVIPKRDHMRAVGDPVYKTSVLDFLRRA